jgi:hypothetical protein
MTQKLHGSAGKIKFISKPLFPRIQRFTAYNFMAFCISISSPVSIFFAIREKNGFWRTADAHNIPINSNLYALINQSDTFGWIGWVFVWPGINSLDWMWISIYGDDLIRD